MSETAAHQRLIRSLGADLRPVRRLAAPAWRALGWIGVVAAAAAALARFADMHAVGARLGSEPDMWLAVVGSTLTTVLAAFAAFQTSVPGRSGLWALLPAPAAALWVGASGLGCLRGVAAAATHASSMRDMGFCALFILGLSAPLSLLVFLMLRRAFPLSPGLTAALGGLASASAAATLLTFFHPHDAAAMDLLTHAVVIGGVVAANRRAAAQARW